MPDILTTKQAAARLHCSDSRIRQLILEGKLPATKLGRDWIITTKNLDLFWLGKLPQRERKIP